MRFGGAIFVAVVLVGAGWQAGVPGWLLALTVLSAAAGYVAGWFDAWGWLQSKLEPLE